MKKKNNPNNQKSPLSMDQLLRMFKDRRPIIDASIPSLEMQLSLGIGDCETDEMKVQTINGRGITPDSGVGSKVTFKVPPNKLGQRHFPPNISVNLTPLPDDNIEPDEEPVKPFIPQHLGYRAMPIRLPLDLQRKYRTIIDPESLRNDEEIPSTIFGHDDRVEFNDVTYPFSTVGMVQTPSGRGTGVMVGPRHILTASHVIDWTPGWLLFEPARFDTSVPYGNAWGTIAYARYEVEDRVSPYESRRDYAVVVLDWRVGDVTGWMGSRAYNPSWDHESYWMHIGYPGDRVRPTFQRAISLNAVGANRRGIRARHQADITGGHSGGPFYAFWDAGPYTVAVQSSQRRVTNYSSGGRWLVDLVRQALREYP